MAYNHEDLSSSAFDGSGNEERRLAELEAYEILDTEAERGFDDIVFLAKNACGTPVALISLVDDKRQWFKARSGFDACETPLGSSVCRHGLASRNLLVIPDLTADARTRENPLVTDDPCIRFYAGAPLVTPRGTVIGMLCVIDTKVRPEGLTCDQQRSLQALAGQVISQFELRKAIKQKDAAIRHERAEAEMQRRAVERLQLAEEAGHVGAFEVNFEKERIVGTREFWRIHGLDEAPFYSIADMSRLVGGTSDIDAAMRSGGIEQGEFAIRRANDDAERWLEVRSKVIHDDSGNVIGLTGVTTDVTDQRAINNEISHRLKNTLALVQAIAGHTMRQVTDPEPVQEFNRRVSALATAHDILLSRTQSAAGVMELAEGVLSRLSIDDRVDRCGPDVKLASRSTLVLSMLLHELGTNAMKYGALSSPEGRVGMKVHLEDRDGAEWLVIEWLESGGPPVIAPDRKGLGARLIERGIAPDGETEIEYNHNGFRATIASPMAQVGA
ncbi:HWE histidine kinase domain-containing protein [Croceicoccus gelatinilyticus]|uniref:HWE histidine kinase domain-containing protein n=1 Tax=Croceicoccus gelatinilyticus TaxID=2835536 RepID=UPI001BCB4895|nr:HWE histidine kinase domain-containing protein [Croceicoccus gelatinilyticus]MBS7670262.1 GAF domain-containing protein [Croceicoccus gelatinilyticus]